MGARQHADLIDERIDVGFIVGPIAGSDLEIQAISWPLCPGPIRWPSAPMYKANPPRGLGSLGGFDHDTIELPRAEELEGMLAGKQSAVAMQHTLATALLPPLAQ